MFLQSRIIPGGIDCFVLVVRTPFQGTDPAVVGVVLELADAKHGEGNSEESSQDCGLEDDLVPHASHARLGLSNLLGHSPDNVYSLSGEGPTQRVNGL